MIRVAIIEDDPTMRGLLSEAIGECEDMIVIEEAENAATASGMIEAGGYDVLLCDLGLPDGNGVDLIRQEALDCIDAIRKIREGGSPISPIIARQLLRKIRPESNADPASMAAPLSERECEVLNLLARGFSNAECADLLTISPNTIGTHVKNIYRKLEVNSRAEALFEASSQGLLSRT